MISNPKLLLRVVEIKVYENDECINFKDTQRHEDAKLLAMSSRDIAPGKKKSDTRRAVSSAEFTPSLPNTPADTNAYPLQRYNRTRRGM